MSQWLGRRHGKLVHTWKDGRVNTAWETLQAGRRPFETSDVYSYLENAKTYIHFKQAGQPAVKITEAECLAAPGCWTIAKARGQTNGTSAPKPPAPRFPEQRWRYRRHLGNGHRVPV